jgi:4-amino-4-deoxychorismate lyase
MNYLFHNNQIIPENSFIISPGNRAFCYGDGVFETMIFREREILYLDDHLLRLYGGLEQLDIELSPTLSKESILEKVAELADKNNLHHNARIKLQVWRKEGGLVTPESSEAEFMITISELKKPQEVKEIAFVSTDIKLYLDNLSKYKTLNFLPYILAGIEKKKRNADEIILTDPKGNIAEGSSSNIFWCKSDTLYTPSLETGCIEGVMRKQIIKFCDSENIKVIEGFFSLSELQTAELVFTSNVSGLSLIENLNDKKINTQYTIYQAIRIGLDLL